jgi:hypothetical protein
MRYFFLLFLGILLSCNPSEKELSGEDILLKSIQKHDPKAQWKQAEFSLRIQEPRLQNPVRFSEVYINNKTNAFALKRNRGDKVASYQLNADGTTTVLLDNEAVQDTTMIAKYMLQPLRVKNYQWFYRVLLGLPMSLNEEVLDTIGTVSSVMFNQKESYKVEIKLQKPLFSDTWNLFISAEDFSLLGIEMIFPNDPSKGERLYFDKNIEIDDVQIPRIRHWYELDDTYSGSDVIVKKLD